MAVQELRAFAALLVVVHHALSTVEQYQLGDSALSDFRYFYIFGIAGVDIFFVISGFIMMYTLSQRRRRDSWHGFLLRRVKRVVPLYWALTSLLVMLMLLLPALFPGSSLDLRHTLSSYLFVPYPNTRGEMFPLLIPGWTLIIEMVFYTLFAVLLFLRENRVVPALAAVFGGYILAVHWLAPGQRVLMWLADPIVFEFVFGCAVARVYLAVRSRPDWLPPVLIAAALSLFATTVLVDLSWMSRALRWGVPASLLVAGVVFLKDPAGRLSRPRKLTMALGDASYSLYLCHPFVLAGTAKLWGALGWRSLPADVYVAIAAALSCAVALCTYHVLERPLGLALFARRERPAAVPRGSRSAQGSYESASLVERDKEIQSPPF